MTLEEQLRKLERETLLDILLIIVNNFPIIRGQLIRMFNDLYKKVLDNKE